MAAVLEHPGTVHQRKVALAGSAHLEFVSGVVQLRPEDTMLDAMPAGPAEGTGA
ncbi:hypothetical protein [Streptomyces sp. CBMA156]|uniref:hypothetical protein n=1 Tax=Streptomyces sp. CBMA156 TaxID=1930280 RepID=UPI001661AABD|nr:hypothetical protein [Streptomyces sp. CBMA156]